VLDLPAILQAATELRVPVQLTIAGSGPEERRLRALCPSVQFLGTLESAALAEVLAQQDVFVLPSAFEGLPISLMEAMAQGCIPVVSDLRSGIPELVQDGVNGFRVPVGDIRGFANRLRELHQDGNLRRQAAEAARSKAGCYCMDHMIESYAALFQKVLEKPFHRPRGPIEPPPAWPWPERLPGVLQSWGHRVRQRTGARR
jgi:glycosyltransferase involved in cell wall biosynthesis